MTSMSLEEMEASLRDASARANVTYDVLLEEWEKEQTEIKLHHPTVEGEFIPQMAHNAVRTKYLRMMASNEVPFVACIYAAQRPTNPFEFVKRDGDDHLKKYGPKSAIAEGYFKAITPKEYLNEFKVTGDVLTEREKKGQVVFADLPVSVEKDGQTARVMTQHVLVYLDNREELWDNPNRNYQKPVRVDDHRRRFLASAAIFGEDGKLGGFQYSTITIYGDAADPNNGQYTCLPTNQWLHLQGRKNPNAPDDTYGFSMWGLHEKFWDKEQEAYVFEKSNRNDLPNKYDEFKKRFRRFGAELKDLNAIVDKKTAETDRTPIAVIGDVTSINRARNVGWNNTIFLALHQYGEELTDDEVLKNVACRIEDDLFDQIEYGEHSQIVVIGRPYRSKQKDEERKVKYDDKGNALLKDAEIQVMGTFGVPGRFIQVSTGPVTKEDLEGIVSNAKDPDAMQKEFPGAKKLGEGEQRAWDES